MPASFRATLFAFCSTFVLVTASACGSRSPLLTYSASIDGSTPDASSTLDATPLDATPPDAAHDAARDATTVLPSPPYRIVVDAMHACAWTDKGAAYCWGRNDSGELGDGTTMTRSVPTLVPSLTDVRQMSVGDWASNGFSCALSSAGTVQCWGSNVEGQLGAGVRAPFEALPVAVRDLQNVEEIASGTHHSCARLTSGAVWCWGMGRDCGIGDGACADRFTPAAAIGIDDAIQLAVGMTFSCALRKSGSVACWGSNSYGEVGNDSLIAALTPTAVIGLHDVVRISASPFNPCAQTRDGRVFCWGNNEYGTLGTGSRAKAVTTPTLVRRVPSDAELMAGARCVVTSTQQVWCWGTWTGDGSSTAHEEGATLVPLKAVIFATGYRSLFAITAKTTTYAWGYNESGQLGTGTTTNQWTPMTVVGVP